MLMPKTLLISGAGIVARLKLLSSSRISPPWMRHLAHLLLGRDAFMFSNPALRTGLDKIDNGKESRAPRISSAPI
jgi:hypothetical protein